MSLFRRFPQYAGAAVSLLGVLIICSWYAHWRAFLQLLPDTAPMQYNTALCFIFCGAGLILLSTKHVGIAPLLGGAAAFFTFLTLLEYLSGKAFGIDQLFHQPFFQDNRADIGRMSPLTTVCFIFSGTGIVLAGWSRNWPHRLTLAGILACVVSIVAIVALCGFFFGVESAYGWGSYSRMAVNTAAAFLVLSGGLLAQIWQLAQFERLNFVRWLPVTGSLTLMAMIAFVSGVNLAELKSATFWRRHTIDVILTTQALEENVLDIQRGMRGYVTLGDTNALASFQTSLELEPRRFHSLERLTRDNPAQQQRLTNLTVAVAALVAYDRREIDLYNRKGFAAVSKTDITGDGRRLFGNARDLLKTISQEEQKLLYLRDTSEQTDFENVTRLLVLGSALAALLLVLANQMATRELRQRRRVEAKLRQVTTLQNAIFNSANYAIIALDCKGVVQTFNPAAERMLGYSAAEVVGIATPILWRDPAEVAAQAEKLSRELGRPVEPGVDVLTARTLAQGAVEYEVTFVRKDGTRFPVLVSLTALGDETGDNTGFLGVIADITDRKKNEAIREQLIAELQQALHEVKTLSGMIPICGWCKNVRSDQGFWQTVEDFVRTRTQATFSHGMCPRCSEKFKADIARANQNS